MDLIRKNRWTRFVKSAVLAAPVLLAPVISHAEIGGMQDGKSADLSNLPDVSVEFGFNFGEYFDLDYQYIGARLNYRISPNFIAYGDIGQLELESADDISFGVGGIYSIDGLLQSLDTAARFSFHVTDGDEIDGDVLALALLISGRNGVGANPDLQWYSYLGLTRLSGGDSSETEFSLGAGLSRPTSSGEIFGGIELIDDFLFGIGYRHFL